MRVTKSSAILLPVIPAQAGTHFRHSAGVRRCGRQGVDRGMRHYCAQFLRRPRASGDPGQPLRYFVKVDECQPTYASTCARTAKSPWFWF